MQSILDQINYGFGVLVAYLYPVLFADIAGVPLIEQHSLIGVRFVPLVKELEDD